MKQPELGIQLAKLRKEKNLTQEELVERCNVSVRTIQRIEGGEVVPRASTVRIIMAALGEDFDTIIKQIQKDMPHKSNWILDLFVIRPDVQQQTEENKLTFLIAAIGGIFYLVLELIKSGLDMAWFADELGPNGNIIYTVVIIALFFSFLVFMRGFILFSHLFGNPLLRISAYMLIFAMLGLSVLDGYTLYSSVEPKTWEFLLLPYGTAAVIFGALGIVFGVSLIKLQDGMGELSKVAGILEILMGGLLLTVVLFFIAYVVLIPTIIIEIILLYRGYEYLVKSSGIVSQGV